MNSEIPVTNILPIHILSLCPLNILTNAICFTFDIFEALSSGLNFQLKYLKISVSSKVPFNSDLSHFACMFHIH